MSNDSLTDHALRILGKRRFLLSIHDPSFPSEADEDIGRGTPYSKGGHEFARFARSLGFNGLQLGPQGRTSRSNASPYDGTAFSRNFLSLSFSALARDPDWSFLVDREALDSALSESARAAEAPHGEPNRTRHEHAYDIQTRLLGIAYERLEESEHDGSEILSYRRFCEQNADWLEPDSMYQALVAEHDSVDWTTWADTKGDRTLYCPRGMKKMSAPGRRKSIYKQHARAVERYRLSQYLVHYQHREFYKFAQQNGLLLFADLQVGLSIRDRWRLQPLFLSGYRLGAPPSRTNSEGQPWGYPVLDPKYYEESTVVGTGLEYIRRRSEKIFKEFDGVRIDHPQGLVCPWIYRTDDPDPFHAVQNGARLFSSPDLEDHPRLAEYSIVRPEQLADEAEVPRHADPWVKELDDDQVDQYARILSVIMDEAQRHNCDIRDVACETLSTQPYPLFRVTQKFGLGRFRVTQKMNAERPDDPYRTDRAKKSDWVMMGNHDTPSIWAVVQRWKQNDEIGLRADYLARRLKGESEAPEFARRLKSDTNLLVHALFADVLLSDSENVVVFFTDLVGSRETYNAPGTVGPANWSLRIASDYRETYPKAARNLTALNVAFALALALESPLVADAEAKQVAKALRREAGVSIL
ncbi:MAG: 4-alpha-glucanotransferase [Spirochaetales bacterium]